MTYLLLLLVLFQQPEPSVKHAIRQAVPCVLKLEFVQPDGSLKGVGTAVVLSEDGIVLTAKHNLEKPSLLKDQSGVYYQYLLLSKDENSEVALVRIQPGKLKAITLAKEDEVETGETVVAIGYPYHYPLSCSTGIISGSGRTLTLPGGVVLGDILQTDAAINPGNSGGPIVNLRGELVGMTVAIQDGARGLAFANGLKPIRAALKEATKK